MTDVQTELNILLIGEEDVTNASLGAFHNEKLAPVFDIAIATNSKMLRKTKYTIDINKLTLNFHNILCNGYDIALCVIDGTRKQSCRMQRC